MAVRDILYCPGSLFADGQWLGLTRSLVFVFEGTGYPVYYDALGAVGEVLDPEHTMSVGAFCRAWNTGAVNKIFPGASGGVVQYPGSRKSGERGTNRGVVLTFQPENASDGVGFTLHNAVPLVEASAELAFQRPNELGIPVLFRATPNQSKDISRIN